MADSTEEEHNEATPGVEPEDSPRDTDTDLLERPSHGVSLLGTVVADRYQVTDLLGVGGMGSVYKAEHIHMRKSVALKVLHREMTILSEVVARFEREAIAAARIEHANVVQARDFGRLEDGACYLVLDYVEGTSLSQALEDERFSVGRSLRVTIQIAEALAAAHEQRIVHRDLKPDNVMLLNHPPGEDWVKVLDFGIAKIDVHERGPSQRPLTRMGTVFGTPEYMAPEQAAGQPVDHRADIYTLGLLLYRMLAGAEPFTSEEVNAVLMMQITQPPPALDERIAEPVRNLVSWLLQKEPSKRPQTAQEVVDRLEQLVETLPEEAQDLVPARSISADAASDQAPPALSTRLDNGIVGRRVPFLGNHIPLWRLSLLALLVTALGTGLVMLLKAQPERRRTYPAPAKSVSSADATVKKPLDANLEKLLGLAFAGDEEALRELERRPEEGRTVREWLALGRGSFKVGRAKQAIMAYREALERDANLKDDAALRKDVWLATKEPAAVDAALELAADHLGSEGADMLYQLWVQTKDVTPTTQRAKRLLQRESVRKQASPALLFLIEWREAIDCNEYRRVLPKAATSADGRALTLLQRVQLQNDCQLPEEALEAAISAAKDRPAPTPY